MINATVFFSDPGSRGKKWIKNWIKMDKKTRLTKDESRGAKIRQEEKAGGESKEFCDNFFCCPFRLFVSIGF